MSLSKEAQEQEAALFPSRINVLIMKNNCRVMFMGWPCPWSSEGLQAPGTKLVWSLEVPW